MFPVGGDCARGCEPAIGGSVGAPGTFLARRASWGSGWRQPSVWLMINARGRPCGSRWPLPIPRHLELQDSKTHVVGLP